MVLLLGDRKCRGLLFTRLRGSGPHEATSPFCSDLGSPAPSMRARLAGGRASIPKNAFGWPILAVLFHARVGLHFASLSYVIPTPSMWARVGSFPWRSGHIMRSVLGVKKEIRDRTVSSAAGAIHVFFAERPSGRPGNSLPLLQRLPPLSAEEPTGRRGF